MNGSLSVTACVIWLVLATFSHQQAFGADKVTIDAAFNNAEGVVLVSGDKKLQIKTNGGEGKEESVGDMGNKFTLKAAYTGKDFEDKILMYGTDFGQVFHVKTGKTSQLKYGNVRKFIRKGGPDAAGARGGTVYFFKGCEMVIRHKWNSWSKPENVEKKGLPCTPDAAWSDGEDMIILKGDQIWRWTKSEEVIGPCPFSGTYSITSWELTPNSEVKARTCADGWKLQCSTNRCFQAFKDSIDYEASIQDCKSKKGDLAKINNEADQKFVESLLENLNAYFYIGLNDRATEGDFRWTVDNSKPTYTRWNKGEPNNYGGNEDCTHLFLYKGVYLWNDIACTNKFYRVCQRPAA